MGRSAAARAAEEAKLRYQSRKPARRVKMSVCPLCEQDIYANQHTAWRVIDGSPARVHGLCLDPQLTRKGTL